ncbi:MAG: hypothetical protein HZB53_15360 [Chloroflexi bacterium]|nr:hypothetical protein [Chloroflexota bacterium]
MKRAKVCLEGPLSHIPFDAWVEDWDWNGWAVPNFEFAEAKRFTELYDSKVPACSGWYDAAADEFCYRIDGDDEDVCYGPAEIKINGKKLKVYPIGAGEWIWSLWEMEPLEL